MSVVKFINPLRDITVSTETDDPASRPRVEMGRMPVLDILVEEGLLPYARLQAGMVVRALAHAALLERLKEVGHADGAQADRTAQVAQLMLAADRLDGDELDTEIEWYARRLGVFNPSPVKFLLCDEEQDDGSPVQRARWAVANGCVDPGMSPLVSGVMSIMRVALCVQLLAKGHKWGMCLLRSGADLAYALWMASFLEGRYRPALDLLQEAMAGRKGQLFSLDDQCLLPVAGAAWCLSQTAEIFLDAGWVPTDPVTGLVLLGKLAPRHEELIPRRIGPGRDWLLAAFPSNADLSSTLDLVSLSRAAALDPDRLFKWAKGRGGRVPDELVAMCARHGGKEAMAAMSERLDMAALRDAIPRRGDPPSPLFEADPWFLDCLRLVQWVEIMAVAVGHGNNQAVLALLSTRPWDAGPDDFVMAIDPGWLRLSGGAWRIVLETALPAVTGKALAKAGRLLAELNKYPGLSPVSPAAVSMLEGLAWDK